MNKFLTQVIALKSAIALINGETVEKFETAEIIEKLESMIETLSRKNSHKVNEKAVATRNALAENVLSILSSTDAPMTVTEIMNHPSFISEIDGKIVSNQRVTSVITPLVDNSILTKSKDGKKSVYSVAINS